VARNHAGLPPFELTAPVLAKALPKGPEWIHEIKHHGHRSAAVIQGGTVRLLTRTHREMTRRFHVIATALLALPDNEAVIDGEVGAQNAQGVATLDNLHRASRRAPTKAWSTSRLTCCSLMGRTCGAGRCSRAKKRVFACSAAHALHFTLSHDGSRPPR
jgi:ATP-dependent DNA ligase